MTAPDATIEALREEVRAALRLGEDRRAILAACQLLARPELEAGERLAVLRIRAAARQRCGHFPAAEDDWTRILELAPDDRGAHSHRGGCLYELGEFQAALEDFQAAEGPHGAEATDLIWRGACRYRLGDVAGARKELRAASALEPDNEFAWRWRAAISDPDGDDLETSLDEVEQAIIAVPQDESFHRRRARLLESLGRGDATAPGQKG